MTKTTEKCSYLHRVTDEGIVDELGGLRFSRQSEVVARVEPDLEVGPEHQHQAGQAHQAQRHRREDTDRDRQAEAVIIN